MTAEQPGPDLANAPDAPSDRSSVGGLADIARIGPVLAVVAHPDDESFGLGAVLAALAEAGAAVRVLCLTHGEASTLGATDDLGELRRTELLRAAEQLGIDDVVLCDFADGHLDEVASDVLDDVVAVHLDDAALLAVLGPGGVTGHPDHLAASESAQRIAKRRGLPVLEWGVSPGVAVVLIGELDTSFVALDGHGALDVEVDRAGQLAAIACHASQARNNPVLARRLELQGDCERVRLWRRTPPAHLAQSIWPGTPS